MYRQGKCCLSKCCICSMYKQTMNFFVVKIYSAFSVNYNLFSESFRVTQAQLTLPFTACPFFLLHASITVIISVFQQLLHMFISLLNDHLTEGRNHFSAVFSEESSIDPPHSKHFTILCWMNIFKLFVRLNTSV